MIYVAVGLPVPQRQAFTYSFPFDLEPRPGQRVWAPWRGQYKTGILLQVLAQAPAEIEAEKIRPLACVLDVEPLLSQELLDMAVWAARYYRAPIGELLATALPPGAETAPRMRLTPEGARIEPPILPAPDTPGLFAASSSRLRTRAQRQGLSLQEALAIWPTENLQAWVQKGWLEWMIAPSLPPGRQRLAYRAVQTPSEAESHKLHPRRQQVLQALQCEPKTPAQLRALASPSLLRAMARDGQIEEHAIEAEPEPRTAAAHLNWPARPRVTQLNPAQAAACGTMTAAAAGEIFLLYGVTGSGKTAVYLECIQHYLERGRTVLLLVPEIGLTPAAAADFEQAFPGQIAILHSGMSAGERARNWHRIRNGEIRLVIGTRSAVWAPLREPGLVIVDEEHDAAFKQQESPRYSGRDLAIWRARRAGAVTVLGSATPSLETWEHARLGRYRKLELPERAQQRPLPRIEVVDMCEEFRRRAVTGAQPRQRLPELILAEPLLNAIRARLERREQALVLINRRGFAPVALCRQCGRAVECRDCSSAMTWHRQAHCLLCHLCGYSAVPLRQCAHCGSEHLYYLGVGSEKVEAELQQQFPAARIRRLDRDSARSRRQFAQVLRAFHAGDLDLLVGTQMIAKGHDLPGVTLVGVVQADQGLHFPDFRAAERTFQLLTQVAGRAGRGEIAGQVILQAQSPGHYAMQAAAAHQTEHFYEREAHFRRQLHYPPFAALAVLQLRHRQQERAWEMAQQLASALRPMLTGRPRRFLGPAPALVARLKREYRFQFLLQCPSRPALQAWLDEIEALRPVRELPAQSLVMDVDPVSLNL